MRTFYYNIGMTGPSVVLVIAFPSSQASQEALARINWAKDSRRPAPTQGWASRGPEGPRRGEADTTPPLGVAHTTN